MQLSKEKYFRIVLSISMFYFVIRFKLAVNKTETLPEVTELKSISVFSSIVDGP